jgi:hypothetical protein
MEYLVVQQFVAGTLDDAHPWTDQMQQFAMERSMAPEVFAGFDLLTESGRIALAAECRRGMLKTANFEEPFRYVRSPWPYITAAPFAVVKGLRVARAALFRKGGTGQNNILTAGGEIDFKIKRGLLLERRVVTGLRTGGDDQPYIAIPMLYEEPVVYAFMIVIPPGCTICRPALQALCDPSVKLPKWLPDTSTAEHD